MRADSPNHYKSNLLRIVALGWGQLKETSENRRTSIHFRVSLWPV
jgi:hypothetical protein